MYGRHSDANVTGDKNEIFMGHRGSPSCHSDIIDKPATGSAGQYHALPCRHITTLHCTPWVAERMKKIDHVSADRMLLLGMATVRVLAWQDIQVVSCQH
jgi:hypothetical protein